jgi:capsule polysaccharide export protein KpsC/LpsZ
MATKDALMFTDLISNIDKIHTTPLGVLRIKKNICFDTDDIVDWCRKKIKNKNSHITRKGKNWYVNIDDCVITVNAYSYTIITAHKIK